MHIVNMFTRRICMDNRKETFDHEHTDWYIKRQLKEVEDIKNGRRGSSTIEEVIAILEKEGL